METKRLKLKTAYNNKLLICTNNFSVSLRCQLQHIRFEGLISAPCNRSTPNFDSANLRIIIELWCFISQKKKW